MRGEEENEDDGKLYEGEGKRGGNKGEDKKGLSYKHVDYHLITIPLFPLQLSLFVCRLLGDLMWENPPLLTS